jgi:SAM-dependent methyltransferase
MMNAPSRSRLVAMLMCFIVGLALALTSAEARQQPSDTQVYERYRAWVSGPATAGMRTEAEVLSAYRKVLADEGLPGAEIDRRLRVISENGRRLEVERWNRILTAPTPIFNVQPNAFLVRATKGVRPGTALDYGMGQGRNAIYLAQQGWTVTGFDPAEQAVAAAQEQARQLGVKLTTLTVGDDQFDFGKAQWDLIVLSYVSFRGTMARIVESLKPGGLVVVEAFHRDSLKNGPIGGGVLYDTNELLKLFESFRVIVYEDVEDKSDFGQGTNRVVRLLAQKP